MRHMTRGTVALAMLLTASCTAQGQSIGELTSTLPEVPVSQTAQWADITIEGPLIERFNSLVVQLGPDDWAHLPEPGSRTRWFLDTDDGCLEVSRDDFIEQANRERVEILGVGEVLESNPASVSANDLFVHDGCTQ